MPLMIFNWLGCLVNSCISVAEAIATKLLLVSVGLASIGLLCHAIVNANGVWARCWDIY